MRGHSAAPGVSRCGNVRANVKETRAERHAQIGFFRWRSKISRTQLIDAGMNRKPVGRALACSLRAANWGPSFLGGRAPQTRSHSPAWPRFLLLSRCWLRISRRDEQCASIPPCPCGKSDAGPAYNSAHGCPRDYCLFPFVVPSELSRKSKNCDTAGIRSLTRQSRNQTGV
jgi:hypothetical protein